jgi:hypothetical protein
LAVAAIGGLGAVALRLRDPHAQGSWGLCPFKALTGWNCPFCGGLRAVNDLGHGQVVEAAHSNLMLVASVPALLVLWVVWARIAWTGTGRVVPARWVQPLLLATTALWVAFTVFRNTPWGSAWRAA